MPDDPRIENLPWVADGIIDSIEDDARTNLYGLDTRPGNAKPGSGDAEGQPLYWSKFIPRRDILESEDRVIKRIVEAFEDEQIGPVVALTQRDWMFSSVDALEFAVIDQLLSVAPKYNLPDHSIIGMPFMATIEESDIAAIKALGELSGLVSDEELIVTSGPFDGGITDDSAPYLRFAILQALSPQAADYILPTLLDVNALSPTEYYTVRILNSLFKHNEALLEAILEKRVGAGWFHCRRDRCHLELFRMDF